MNHKRVERIWRREGLKVPQKQPKPGRLWLTDGSCVRHRPTHRIHIWAYDFVAVWTKAGRPLKLLTIVDEYTRECLAIETCIAACDQMTSFTGLASSSCRMARPSKFGPITARSSRRKRFGRGYTVWGTDPVH